MRVCTKTEEVLKRVRRFCNFFDENPNGKLTFPLFSLNIFGFPPLLRKYIPRKITTAFYYIFRAGTFRRSRFPKLYTGMALILCQNNKNIETTRKTTRKVYHYTLKNINNNRNLSIFCKNFNFRWLLPPNPYKQSNELLVGVLEVWEANFGEN